MTTKTAARIISAWRVAPDDTAAAPGPQADTRLKTACSTCNLRELCAPCCGLSGREMNLANGLGFHRSHVRRGGSLYRSGDAFTALYAVRRGFFKSTALIENGREQVTGYAITGELLGLDGIGPARHECNAVALEDSEVCAIAFAGLQKLAQEIPSLQRQFHRMMSREIVRAQGLILQLGSMNADKRVAMFLLNLSRRFAARGFSPSEFDMRMTREEIGSYLGLKLETVSRTLSRFHGDELIDVKQKAVHILNYARLQRIAGHALH